MYLITALYRVLLAADDLVWKAFGTKGASSGHTTVLATDTTNYKIRIFLTKFMLLYLVKTIARTLFLEKTLQK